MCVDKVGASTKVLSVRVIGGECAHSFRPLCNALSLTLHLTTHYTSVLQPEVSHVLNEALVFSAHESEKHIEFQIADDAVALEHDQHLFFALEVITLSGVQLGEYNSTTITIEDDDGKKKDRKHPLNFQQYQQFYSVSKSCVSFVPSPHPQSGN